MITLLARIAIAAAVAATAGTVIKSLMTVVSTLLASAIA